jgi:hypothetical protein
MTDKTYNGWTNYATWRVNLEIFDSLPLEDFSDAEDVGTLAQALQERAEYYVECSSEPGLARDYALAFMADVNWHEIAAHMFEEAAE